MFARFVLVLNRLVLYTFWLMGMRKMVGLSGSGGSVDLIVVLLFDLKDGLRVVLLVSL